MKHSDKVLCPNCQTDDIGFQVTDNIEYIKCLKCGWFKVSPEGEYIPVLEPSEPSKIKPPDEAASATDTADDAGGDTAVSEGGQKVDPPAIIKNDDDDDDWYDFTIEFGKRKKHDR